MNDELKRPFPSLRELLSSGFQDSRRIIIMMCLTLIAAIAAAVLIVPTYMASSTLLVLLSPEYAYRPEAGAESFVNMSLERDAILSSEISILTSENLQAEVVNKIGVHRLYPDFVAPDGWIIQAINRVLHRGSVKNPMSLALSEFAGNLMAYPDKSGNTIQVGFRHPNPAVSADVVNELVAAYLRARQSIYLDVQSHLVETQAEALHTELDRVSADLNQYQLQSGISDFATQLDILLRQRGDLNRSLQQIDMASAEAAQRVETIKAQLAVTPREIVQFSDDESDRRSQPARDALAALRQRETELRRTYTDNSDKVTGIRSQIKAMENDISSQQGSGKPSATRRGLNEVYATLDLDRLRAEGTLAAASQQRATLQAEQQQIDGSIKSLYEKKSGLEERQRQKALIEQNYAAAMKTLDDRRMQEGVEAKKATNVRVIQAAGPPLKSNSIRIVILAGGCIVSLIVAILTAFLSDVFRRGFISPERLERRTGLRVLASISSSHSLQPILSLAEPDGRKQRMDAVESAA